MLGAAYRVAHPCALAILSLTTSSIRTEVEHAALALGKRVVNARSTLNLLYRKPIVSAVDMEKALSLGKITVNALIQDFERLGILKEVTGQQRGRIYGFHRYLNLFLS